MLNTKPWSFKHITTVLLSLVVALVGTILIIQVIPSHHAVLAQSEPTAASKSASSGIIPGSTFTFAFAADFSTLDPARGFQSRMVSNQIYETLVTL